VYLWWWEEEREEERKCESVERVGALEPSASSIAEAGRPGRLMRAVRSRKGRGL